jgi:hypothetical protein
MKRSIVFTVLLLAGAGCIGTAGMQWNFISHSDKRAAYEAVLHSATLVAEAQTCTPPTGYEMHCGAFGRVHKSGKFRGLLIKTINCPEAAPCDVGGTITINVKGRGYTSADFVGKLSRSSDVYSRRLTFEMRWNPAFSRVDYTVSFDSNSGSYEGYTRLEWQRPKSGKSGWFGLIRIGSQAEANAAHWDEHFP